MHYHELNIFVKTLCEQGNEVLKEDDCFVSVGHVHNIILMAKKTSEESTLWSVTLDKNITP